MNNQKTVMITRPMKVGDPTEYTYQWGEIISNMVRSYGYNLIDIKKNDVTYENVSISLVKYKPRLYIHIGHGCPNSLQGQKECVMTRRFGVDELLSMPNFKEIIMPLVYASGCKNSCMTLPDICNPLCSNDTNVNLLKGTMVYTIACYSSLQLGKCAVKYGADVYCGFNDLMLFPVDDKGSQDLFRNIHIVFIKNLLEGKSVAEAEYETNMFEDTLIKFYIDTKYISLPILWNKLKRGILGNKETGIFT